MLASQYLTLSVVQYVSGFFCWSFLVSNFKVCEIHYKFMNHNEKLSYFEIISYFLYVLTNIILDMMKKKINENIQKLLLACKLDFAKVINNIHEKIIYIKNKIIPKVKHYILISYCSAWSKQKLNMNTEIGLHASHHNSLNNF